MKVLLVGNNELYLLPFARFYIDVLKENNISFDYIYRNRSKKVETKEDQTYLPFFYNMNTYGKRFYKLNGYLKFRKFINLYIFSKKYDFIIFLNTQTILVSTFLKRFKRINYIFDYRDESFEKISLYRKIVANRIKNSNLTVMSSPGFINIFHDCSLTDKIVISHNKKFNKIILYEKTNSQKIRINFWGMVRHVDYMIKIIKLFDAETVEFSFFGEGYVNDFKEKCKNLEINNIKFYGKYNPEDLVEFAKNTDVLFNCYPNDSIQKQALTCKMYEGIFFNIPQIVAKNSFMDKYLTENNYIHFSIDERSFDMNEFLDFYKSTSSEILKISGEKIINKINNDNEIFKNRLLEAFNDAKK